MTDKDIDLAVITGRSVAVIGYGNQGRAQALNLRDSGVTDMRVCLRTGSASAAQARADGFVVVDMDDIADVDLVAMMAPDEHHAAIYEDIAPKLKAGAAILFCHGLAIHFGLIMPKADIDVILVAPKGPGHALRGHYEAGHGLPGLFAVHQDATGHARDIVLAYAAGLGCGRAAVIETSFAEECKSDLFGEQAVLCGGIPALIEAGFETLVEAGYSPEIAYFECVSEAKLITDLIYERGLAGMRKAISNTAEFGGYSAGAGLITDELKRRMRDILIEIEDGSFTTRFVADCRTGGADMERERSSRRGRPIERAGEAVRRYYR